MEKITVQTLQHKHRLDRRVLMLTAYDYPMARVVDEYADLVLVGDSLAMVILGHPDTTQVSMDAMIHHAQAARRGVQRGLLVGDMPLEALNQGPAHALRCAQRFIQEAGCELVKVEWRSGIEASVAAMCQAGIAVIGHVGLTPQTAVQEGGFGVRGKGVDSAWQIVQQAEALVCAGCCALVLECIPDQLAQVLQQRLPIATLGIGSGPHCDGQVVVTYDVLGLFERFKPRFIKRYADLAAAMRQGLQAFCNDVQQGIFPGPEQTVMMQPEPWQQLRQRLGTDTAHA